MSLTELLLIAVGLSMDAFAVAICKGLALTKLRVRDAALVGLFFGGFQGGMPLLGYFLGYQFKDVIARFDHWIAFILLVIIGGNMLKDAFDQEEESCDASLSFKNLAVLAVATSIDALAVGVTFAFWDVQIIPAVSFIGIITFLLSMVGVKIGNLFGCRYKSKAEMAGGIILILMGTKILLEHLGIFA